MHWVKGHYRYRNGTSEWVRGHWRGAPSSSGFGVTLALLAVVAFLFLIYFAVTGLPLISRLQALL
jgi:hypothetical protein